MFQELSQELLTAFCLVLIIEGVMPFLYPNRWKHTVKKMAEIDSQTMRMLGLASMLLGLFALYLVR